MKKPKILRTMTDRFSLFNDGRKMGANQRNYAIQSVQKTFNDPRTKELLRLGEAYGYYGHGARQRANKLTLPENDVIMLNGRPVVVENVPSNRTVSISCSDDGVVEHTQEVLDTPSGLIIDSLINSSAGGWSWATGGSDSQNQSIARTYHGMDYVLQPNYLSLDHPAMMMESANGNQMLLESLQSKGFDLSSSQLIAGGLSWQAAYDAEKMGEMESQLLYLESLTHELQEKLSVQQDGYNMLLEAIESLPIFVSDETKEAFKMQSEDDKRKVQALFESVKTINFDSLPLDNVDKPTVTVSKSTKLKNDINFDRSKLFFS